MSCCLLGDLFRCRCRKSRSPTLTRVIQVSATAKLRVWGELVLQPGASLLKKGTAAGDAAVVIGAGATLKASAVAQSTCDPWLASSLR